ncbi:Abi family protein [Sulfurimonas sp. SAG-AH-194-C21]|nr:Abi family protein [Sulfurimonas sp. SAG-AH-194-C21]MDF1884142.1 Abi family protein [Sulfurimonas sp. SAG-AH-194-C21]
MNYTKSYKTTDEQLLLLKSKNLIISNETYARLKLKHIGYYRLSAYFEPLQYKQDSNQKNTFLPNVSFEDIVSLYYFDTKLRKVVFEAIEYIEVYFRSQIAGIHASQYGAFAYLNKENLKCNDSFFNTLQNSIKKETQRSQESFVKHFKKKYNSSDLPIWVVVEVVSMSTLSKMYASLKTSEQLKVVAPFLGINKDVLFNWFHALTVVRNKCAHHARLWNTTLGVKFEVPKKKELFQNITLSNAKIFFCLNVILFMLESIGEELEFKRNIKDLLHFYPKVDLSAMGFISNWEEHALWK